jgi:hypothetical protein
MITEPMLPIERKGVDLIQVRNLLHVVMLAEPGWVIPAGHFERRYAALEVSSARRRDQSHFKPLHQQIEEGGAEAMFHDLRQMDLGDWHPRDLPDRLLNGAALQKQQGHTLPPLEQWYLGLLHNGSLPGALPNRPNTAPTRRLVDDARDKFPRLRYDLSEAALRTFLVDSLERIGISCAKYKNSAFNGWSFPTLAECREAWEAKYGLVTWDNPADEWGGSGSAAGDADIPDRLRTIATANVGGRVGAALLGAVGSTQAFHSRQGSRIGSPQLPSVAQNIGQDRVEGSGTEWRVWMGVFLVLSQPRTGSSHPPYAPYLPYSPLSPKKEDWKVMKGTIYEVLNRLEPGPDEIEVAADASPLDFLCAVYRDARQPMPAQNACSRGRVAVRPPQARRHRFARCRRLCI